MICILLEEVDDHLDDQWRLKADRAKAGVKKKAEEARQEAKNAGKNDLEADKLAFAAMHKAINSKSSVWFEAKQALKAVSHDKCWYCECRQDRSDMAVDHFRPKNEIIEEDGHPGYYWLAFSWENFRLSCTFCNSLRYSSDRSTSGGKDAHFPIIEPPKRPYNEAEHLDRPQLLDPTDPYDVSLLTFRRDGFPDSSKRDLESSARVRKSIEIYHLRHVSLVRRRKDICRQIGDLVRKAEASRLANNMVDFSEKYKKLISLTRAKAEFAGAARVYLSAHRKYPWVKEIFNRHL